VQQNENYPNDWLCTCGHRKAIHGSTVETKGSGSCYAGNGDLDACYHFKPMDNLTYVERLANARATDLPTL
jgi:hypothetical protein